MRAATDICDSRFVICDWELEVGNSAFSLAWFMEASRAKARVLIDQAKRALDPLGVRAEPIRALADFIFERRS